ncbi:hypothetical protein R1sor_008180 [Riccia sorocarpa]|uniref:Protein kinase domain-containing protein n=1 Tax=Riccia sorocarpa TaxID=122646 RepID=A0ABD3HW35_9MARC
MVTAMDTVGKNTSAHTKRAVQLGPRITEAGGENVHKALTRDGELLAVKKVKVTLKEEDKTLVEELQMEIKILSTTSHQNIVQYRSCELVQPKYRTNETCELRLYMDFVHHDTLETRYTEFPLSERQTRRYTRDILSGINYLHEKNIVHRDIRCANIWVDDTGVCKLVNFGKAKELKHRREKIIISAEAQSFTSTGYPHWMAPEIAGKSEPYQMPVDIWSLGCTVLEMLTRERPWGKDVEELDVITELNSHQIPTIPATLSEAARNFLVKCLQPKPENRPTAKKLLDDPFVNPEELDQLGSEDSSIPFVPEDDTLESETNSEDSSNDSASESTVEQEFCLELTVDEMSSLVAKELEDREDDPQKQ